MTTSGNGSEKDTHTIENLLYGKVFQTSIEKVTVCPCEVQYTAMSHSHMWHLSLIKVKYNQKYSSSVTLVTFFLWYWSLNSGLMLARQTLLSLEPLLQPLFCVCVGCFQERVLRTLCALYLDPPDLCLLSS
jgi:hypothetical protein